MKKVNNNKVLIKLAFFSSFGQYRDEKQISTYITMIIFEAFFWLMVSLLFLGQQLPFMLSESSIFIFAVGVKAIFALIEKYGELRIGYDLKKYFIISNFDILKLRLFYRLINISEYCYVATVLFFSYRYIGAKLFIVNTLVVIIVTVGIIETISFVSYKYEKFRAPVMNIFIASICCITYSLASAFEAIDIPNIVQAIEFISITIAAISLSMIPLNICSKSTQQGVIEKSNKSMLTKEHSQMSLLLRKEFVYLFVEKPSALISPVIYLIIFYLLDGWNIVGHILPMYFVIEFATLYSFNYWGHENDSLPSIFLSPIKKNILIKAKSFCLLILGSIYTVIGFCISVIAKQVSMVQAVRFFSLAILAMGIVLLISPYYSVKYYSKVKGRQKYMIQSILVTSILFFAHTIVQWTFSNIALLVCASAVFAVSIYFCFFNNQWQSEYLQKNERKILGDFIQ